MNDYVDVKQASIILVSTEPFSVEYLIEDGKGDYELRKKEGVTHADITGAIELRVSFDGIVPPSVQWIEP